MAENHAVTRIDDDAAKALLQSFTMIIFSEIGDKTFLIAAILAMRHPRLMVFAGAFGSLAVMSLLSAELGHVLPALIPKRWTQLSAAVLFLVFGIKMLQEAREMKAGNEKLQEEMKEAEKEIEGDDAELDAAIIGGEAIPLETIEEGRHPLGPHPLESTPRNGSRHIPTRSRSNIAVKSWSEGARNFFSLFLGPVFVQAFILTFLGEWGDRSQISTIALGAAHNVYIVTLGTVVGHACCTALAVIAGRYISTKISIKHVTLAGSALFIIFGVIYLYEAFISIDIDVIDVTDFAPP